MGINKSAEIYYKLSRRRRMALFALMLAKQWPMWVWNALGLAAAVGLVLGSALPRLSVELFSPGCVIMASLVVLMQLVVSWNFFSSYSEGGKRVPWEIIGAALLAPSLALGPVLKMADDFAVFAAGKAAVSAQVARDAEAGSVDFAASKKMMRALRAPLRLMEGAVDHVEWALTQKETYPAAVFEKVLSEAESKFSGLPLIVWTMLGFVLIAGLVGVFRVLGAPFRLGWEQALGIASEALVEAAGTVAYVVSNLAIWLPWAGAKWLACKLKAGSVGAWGSIKALWGRSSARLESVAGWSPRRWTAAWSASVIERGMADPELRARIEAEALESEVGAGSPVDRGARRL